MSSEANSSEEEELLENIDKPKRHHHSGLPRRVRSDDHPALLQLDDDDPSAALHGPRRVSTHDNPSAAAAARPPVLFSSVKQLFAPKSNDVRYSRVRERSESPPPPSDSAVTQHASGGGHDDAHPGQPLSDANDFCSSGSIEDAHLSRSPSSCSRGPDDGHDDNPHEYDHQSAPPAPPVPNHGPSIILSREHQIPVGSVPNPRRRRAQCLALLVALALAAGIFAWKYHEMTSNSSPKIWDSVFNASQSLFSPIATNSSAILASNGSSLASKTAPPVPNASENGVRSSCSGYYSCYSCTEWEGCGWCSNVGRCTRGSDGGSTGLCTYYYWAYYQDECATPCSAGSYSSDGWVSAPLSLTHCASLI